MSTTNAISIAQLSLGSTSTSGGIGHLADSTAYSSLTAITSSEITSFVNTIATYAATNGAEQSRLNFASQLATNDRTSLEAANSSISDTDIAQATTALAKWNVLVQAGTSMLTQANNSAQTVLKLITG